MPHLIARGGPPGALRPPIDPGPDAWASRRGPRLPGGPPCAIKWVIINAPWYQSFTAYFRSSAIVQRAIG